MTFQFFRMEAKSFPIKWLERKSPILIFILESNIPTKYALSVIHQS